MADRQDNVRSLTRGLKILRFVNAEGAARPAEISLALGIPRPTIYRLLRTLEEAGYIFFSASDSRARVSPRASGLGDNSAARSRLCRVAAPLILEFTDEHAWPLDISVFHDLRMIIEETTHWRSPFSVDANMAGSHLPMLRSSAGRAYLSFCDDKERQIILDLLENEADPLDQPFLQTNWVNENLKTYRKQGYATRGPKAFRPKTSSLAVPVMLENRVVGCLSIIWITSAFSMTEATSRYATKLIELSQRISLEISDDKH